MLESLNNATGLSTSNVIKKGLQNRCFHVNIAKFLKTPIFKNPCKWLLLANLITYFGFVIVSVFVFFLAELSFFMMTAKSFCIYLYFITACLQISLLLLTLSWRTPLSYRNQSIDLLLKSMDWFLYGNSLHHERVKQI